jgi:hypothetical protein
MSSKVSTEASSASKVKSTSSTFFGPSEAAVQFKMAVGPAGDKFEREADHMADKVLRMPEPKVVTNQTDRVQRQPQDKLAKQDQDKIRKAPAVENKLQKAALPPGQDEKRPEALDKAGPKQTALQRQAKPQAPGKEEKLQRKATGKAPKVSDNLQTAIQSQATGGQALPADVRSYMEGRFHADFSGIRIHNNREAANLNNQLSARAFTFKNHIFFGPDQYQPGSSDGKQLIAHELTHTIQQGHAIQRSPQISTAPAKPLVQRLFGIEIPSWQDVVDWLADKAYNIPGYRMFTIVIGSNPINGANADRSAANILRAIVEFLPGGKLITDALEKYQVFEKAGTWVEGQLKRFGNLLGTIKAAIDRFFDDLDFIDIILHPGRTWDRAVKIFSEPVDNIISFIKTLFAELFDIIRKAVLLPLAKLAEGKPGFDLLCAVLGENPVTGDKVARSPENLIGGFMKMIGREDLWENIQKGKAIQRAWKWFDTALNGLLGLVRQFPVNFINMLKSLELMDFIVLPNLFVKVFKVFGQFVLDFGKWALNTVLDLLEILFSVVAPGVMPYIKKAQTAFSTILKDPIGFVGNLVKAGKQGFEQFKNNIAKHLKEALIKWLVGPLAEAGVYIPKSFDLIEIVKLVLSVLGLTWQNIRGKLVKIIPEPVLVGLEKTAGILVTLVKDGPAAAWEQIKTELTELKDQLISQFTQMISTEIVKAAVTKLVMMLNPAGAVIQAIIATYNTVTFFIEKINQIAAVVAAYIDSIAAIAAGQIMPAAKKVETTMANTLTVIIAFLAKFAGLGGIPTKLVGIVQKIRKPIDAGLDKIVAWLGNMLKKIKSAVSEWWKQKKPFTNKAGETHTLSFSGSSEANASLQISTTTMSIGAYLTQKRQEAEAAKDEVKKSKVAKAESLVTQKVTILKAGSKTEDEKTKNALVVATLTEISQTLMDLGGGGPLLDSEYPNPQIVPGSVPPSNASMLLQNKPKLKKGTPTSGHHGTVGWDYVQTKNLSTLKGDKWVQMHLVSELLGGEAVAGNLVPAPNSVNSAWRSGVENSAKSLVDATSSNGSKNLVWLQSTVSYYSSSPDEANGAKFAKSVQTKAGLYMYQGKDDSKKAKFQKVDTPAFVMSAQIPSPDFAAAKTVSLNSSSGSHLRDLAKVDARIVNDIKRNRPYFNIGHFESKMLATLDSRIKDPNSAEYKNLKAAILSVRNNSKVVVSDTTS